MFAHLPVETLTKILSAKADMTMIYDIPKAGVHYVLIIDHGGSRSPNNKQNSIFRVLVLGTPMAPKTDLGLYRELI